MNSTVQDLGRVLAESMAAGHGSATARHGAKEQAFAYLEGPLNSTIAYVNAGVSESHSFTALVVDYTDDVVEWTAGDKTDTATINARNVNLGTYPGAVSIKSRELLDSNGLGSACGQALYMQAASALDRALVTELKAASGSPIAKAADLAAIAEGQAQLMSMGYTPDLCVVSSALYATLAGSGMLVGGNNPQDKQSHVLGSRLTVSSSLTGAEAIVLDSRSVQAVEHESSPVALSEVKARQNSVDLVVEVIGGFVVVSPLGIVHIATA